MPATGGLLLAPGALTDADVRGDDDGFGCRHFFLSADPLEIEFGGFSSDLHAMLVDSGQRGGHELCKGLIGEAKDTQSGRDRDTEGGRGVHDTEGLVVGDGKDGIGSVRKPEQGQSGLVAPLAGEDIVDDEIIGDGEIGLRYGGDETLFTVLEGFYTGGATEEGDVPVACADEAFYCFVGDGPVVIDDLETIKFVQASVELNNRDLVFCDLAEMVGADRLFCIGDKDAVDVLVDEGFDGLALHFVRFVGLADDEAVVVGKADLFDAGDGVGEKALIDMRNDNPDDL